MSTGYMIGLLAIGLLAGFMSSMIGIGGGVIIVPFLVFMFGMDQIKAQGTSLAMLLPPIGLLGVWQYYKHGQVDLKIAAVLCLAFLFGSFFGAKVVMNLDKTTVKRVFAICMILMAVKYLFFDTPSKKEINQETRPTSGLPK